jgi:DNA-directed RNA polymerase specialized sigma24 family protein
VSDEPDDVLVAGIASSDRFLAEQSAEELFARYEDALLLALFDVVHDPLIALDVCAEAMAFALRSMSRLAMRPAAVVPWLFELAEAVLVEAVERECVPAAARHELGVPRAMVTGQDLARIEELAEPDVPERARLTEDLVCASERLRRQAPARSVLQRIRVSGHVATKALDDREAGP